MLLKLIARLIFCAGLFVPIGVAVAQDANLLYQMGVESREAGRFKEAAKQLEAAAELRPDNADIQVQLGLSLSPLERFEEARKAFGRALELAPDYVDAKIGLARLQYFDKQYGEARQEIESVLDSHPDSAEARALLDQIEKAIGATKQTTAAKQKETEPAERTAKEKGIEAREAGNLDEAIKLLQEAAKLNPDDADIQLQLGLALSASKRFDAARKHFERTLELAPDYIDAKVGIARLDFFSGDYKQAREKVLGVLKSTPAYTDAQNLLTKIEKAITAKATAKKHEAKKVHSSSQEKERRWRLDVNGGWSGLSGDRPDWWEGDARLTYDLNAKYTLSAFVDQARRFNIDDTLFEARLDHTPSDNFSDYLFIAVTPDAAFLPQMAAGTGFRFKFRDSKGLINASVLTLDARYARYVTGDVEVFNPGLEQYFYNGRVWLTARWINVVDQFDIYSAGYLLRGDVMITHDLRIFGGYADAPENVDANIVRTRSLFGGLEYEVNDNTDWRIAIGHDDREGLFEQILVSTGVSRKF